MLHELQQQVFSALRDSTRQPQALAHLAGDSVAATRGLQIYSSSIEANLVQALEQTYPVCRRLVGQDFFGAMAARYVQQHWPRSPDIADYGAKLAGFIAQFVPAAELPYLADTARLEWAWHRAFNAPDLVLNNLSCLEYLDADLRMAVVFHLPYGSSLLASAYPIDQIWRSNQIGNDESGLIDLAQGPVRVMVWRYADETQIAVVSAEQWFVLQCLQRGWSLGRIVQRFVQRYDPDLFAACLEQLLRRHWVQGLSLAPRIQSSPGQ